MRSGERWVRCRGGHSHWGEHGAAGLFLVADGHLLMQRRAMWSHHGGTWGIPGGARQLLESAPDTALREAVEEADIDIGAIDCGAEYVDDHDGWAYTTVTARASRRFEVRPAGESIAVEWVPLGEIGARDLHPGFAGTLPNVLGLAG